MSELLKKERINNRVASVPVKVSISNTPNGVKPSLYNRLTNYRKDKGLKDQDVLRFALSMLLDKVGY